MCGIRPQREVTRPMEPYLIQTFSTDFTSERKLELAVSWLAPLGREAIEVALFYHGGNRGLIITALTRRSHHSVLTAGVRRTDYRGGLFPYRICVPNRQ